MHDPKIRATGYIHMNRVEKYMEPDSLRRRVVDEKHNLLIDVDISADDCMRFYTGTEVKCQYIHRNREDG